MFLCVGQLLVEFGDFLLAGLIVAGQRGRISQLRLRIENQPACVYFFGLDFTPFAVPPLGMTLVGPLPTLVPFGPLVTPNLSLTFPIPDDPALVGFEIGCQAFLTTAPGGINSLSLTNRSRVRIF